MKKTKPKGQEGPQEIKVRFEKEKMIFGIGDQEFYLTEETAGKIFGRSVGLEFEKLQGQDENFGGLRTLENYVRVQRLMRKGLGMDKVAEALNVSEEKLRQFYSFERGRPHVESWGPNETEIERKKQAAAEMDFVREAPRSRNMSEQLAPEPGERFIDLRDIKNLQRQGMKNKQIAEWLKVDSGEFKKFMGKNEKYLRLLP